jgi:hypothetical protein
MPSVNKRLLLLGGAAALAIAIPAIGQEAPPESLLPPGFGDPNAPPPPPPPPPVDTTPGDLPPEEGGAAPRPRQRSAPSDAVVEDSALEDLAALEALIPTEPPVEIPDASRRPTDIVGVLDDRWSLGTDAYGNANGRFLSTLMRRLDAPVPSRWGHILLRRALLSRVPAPSSVNSVDWVAERAWLLLRMGEADGARMLVQSLDVDKFTPKMFAIAVQAGLATSDPAALCPLVEPGSKTSDEPVWPLADAMCASMSGEPTRASTLIDHARRRSKLDAIDIDLAEKVIGSGANTKRAVTIKWDDVGNVNSWRFGLASATGMTIPPRLMSGAGRHVVAWQARAPMIPVEERIGAANVAASLGVFSNQSLVEMHSLILDTTDPSEVAESIGGRLRLAYAARDMGVRMRELRRLWDNGGDDADTRHAGLILTAAAAAGIPPSGNLAEDVPQLIASMLTAGLDERAARWSGVVEAMEAGRRVDRAWAMLALASPRPAVDISAGRIETFQGSDQSEETHATKLLMAGLAGLGRIDADTASGLAETLGVRLGAENLWTRALARAAQNGQKGTVALLAGVGMQTRDWRGVPPEHLFHITRALARVGLEYEARMIAAEAVARL